MLKQKGAEMSGCAHCLPTKLYEDFCVRLTAVILDREKKLTRVPTRPLRLHIVPPHLFTVCPLKPAWAIVPFSFPLMQCHK